jgi:hypothetical protein
MRSLFRITVGVIVVACLIYLAGPLWAGWNLRQGVRTRNVALLETYVDWPQLRANLKPRISDAIKENADNSGVISGTVKRALGSVLSDAAVDTFVTPANLSRILAGRAFILQHTPDSKPAGQGSPSQGDDAEDPDDPMPPKRLRWAFFESPTRFRVESVNPKLPPGSRIVSILALEGLQWKLIDVEIVKR